MWMRWLTLLLFGTSFMAQALPPPGPIDLLVRVDRGIRVPPVLHSPGFASSSKQILFRYDPSAPSLKELASFEGLPAIKQFVPMYTYPDSPDFLYVLTEFNDFFALKNSPQKTLSPSEYVPLPALPKKVTGIFPWALDEILIATADQRLFTAQPSHSFYQNFAHPDWLSQLTGIDPSNEEILKIERLGEKSFAVLSTKGLRLARWARGTGLYLKKRFDWVQLTSYGTGDKIVDFMADGERGGWILLRDQRNDHIVYVDYDDPHKTQRQGLSMRFGAAFLDVNGSGELFCSLDGEFHKLCHGPWSGTSTLLQADAFKESSLRKLGRYELGPGFILSSSSLYAPRSWRDPSTSPYLFQSSTPFSGVPVKAPSPSPPISLHAPTQSTTPSEPGPKKSLEEAFIERVEALRAAGKLKDQPARLNDWTPKNFCEALDDLPDLKLFLVNRTVDELKETLGLYKGFQQRFSPASEPYSRKKFPWKALWQMMQQNGCEFTLAP